MVRQHVRTPNASAWPDRRGGMCCSRARATKPRDADRREILRNQLWKFTKGELLDLIPATDMTLEDWFAGQAIQGTHAMQLINGKPACPHEIAEWAYIVAEAMMDERQESRQ